MTGFGSAFAAHVRRIFASDRETMMLLFALIGIANTVVFSLLAQTREEFWSVLICTGALIVISTARILGLLRFRPTTNLFMLTVLITVVYNASLTGGILSPSLAWLGAITMPALFILGPKTSLRWFAVVLASIIVLAVMSGKGMLPPPSPPTWERIVWATLLFIGSCTSMLIVPLTYHFLHQKSLRQLTEKNHELESARDELIVAQQHKDNFVAAVSHEMRTPMNAILGFVDLIHDRKERDPDLNEMIAHIRNSAGHLLTVINDLLDFSQLQVGKLAIRHEPFDLHAVIGNAFSLFLNRVEPNRVDYRLNQASDVPQCVVGDSHRLMQILVNLLGNAIKFTPSGFVHLNVRKDDGALIFEVSDSGIGISKSEQAHIFDRFAQANVGVQKAFGGTGLGLAISKSLAVLQGGSIEVESDKGHGALFRVHLPFIECTSEQQQALLAQRPALAQGRALRVLVVDDNKVNRIVARQTIVKLYPGSTIVEAENGLEAIEILRHESFDLALLDMLMPIMDGIQAAERIRRELPEPARSMPLIALTANVSPADLQRCFAAGMNDVLFKPFEREQFQKKIDNALNPEIPSTSVND